MGKRVIFEIGEGNFDQGFPVKIRIWEEGKPQFAEIVGEFPPAPEIPQTYDKWRSAYSKLPGDWLITVPKTQITNVSNSEVCHHAAQNFLNNFNTWLNQPLVRKLEREFLITINKSDNLRVIIQTQNPLLRKLPWHLWQLWEVFDDHHIKPEVVISSEYKPSKVKLKTPVKILAIFGSNHDLHIESDLQSLMEKLPGATIEPLLQPSRKVLLDKLWHQSWDILFFAGHSSSGDDGSWGEIQINNQENLPISDLHHSLAYAVKNGLKLAIFNSCDGLGLAHHLSDLRIPYIIVMREPVPDIVAQHFLKYFLTFFASGESLYTSVQKSRMRLHEELETKYPCASWIPIIFQNPAASVLKYPQHNFFKTKFFRLSIFTSLIVFLTLVVNLYLKDIKFQQRFSSGEKVLVKSAFDLQKQEATTALWWKNYKLAITKFQQYLQDHPQDAEAKIYLENAKISNQPTLNIAVVVPTGSNPNVALEILRGVAQAQHKINYNGGINGKVLKIKIANDDNNPIIAKKIADQLVKDPKIIGVVGHNSSDASVPASDIYQAGKLVMISPTSTSIKLTDRDDRTGGNYIYRSVISFAIIAETLIDYAHKTGITRILICNDTKATDQSFDRSLNDAVMRRKDIQFISDIKCDFADHNFQSVEIVRQAIRKDVNAILLNPQVDRISKAFEIGKANQGRIKLLGNPSLYTKKTLDAGKFVQGMIMAVPWQSSVSPNPKFVENANIMWKNPSLTWRTATAFDATQVMAAAMQNMQNQNSQRRDIQKALSQNFVFSGGATGTIRFLHYGDRTGDRDGKAVLVKITPDQERKGKYTFVSKSDSPLSR
ncbi:MAG: ABC transporter substrate-binding protein [Sphaerospermopsis sp. SIO1G2]|nr:ABC transporter substrate-binding protein [Sphaerospermopsis sp. SIO1G2]